MAFAALPSWQQAILTDVERIYRPLSQQQGRDFSIEINEENSSVAASAEFSEKSYKVILYAGLLQAPKLTPDALRIVICHELGHLFAGAPRRHIPHEWEGAIAPDGLSYMSSEGQADYYSTAACFRKLVVDPLPSPRAIPAPVRSRCAQVWGVSSLQALSCERAAVAGYEFLRLIFDFEISFETPDLSNAPSLVQDGYPGRQCRLDTLFAGALCKDSKNLAWDFLSTGKNECSEPSGKRPACWHPDSN